MYADVIVIEPSGEPTGVIAKVWNRVNEYDEDEPFVEKRVDRVEIGGLTLTGVFNESAVEGGVEIGIDGRMDVNFTETSDVTEDAGRVLNVVMEVENRRGSLLSGE